MNCRCQPSQWFIEIHVVIHVVIRWFIVSHHGLILKSHARCQGSWITCPCWSSWYGPSARAVPKMDLQHFRHATSGSKRCFRPGMASISGLMHLMRKPRRVGPGQFQIHSFGFDHFTTGHYNIGLFGFQSSWVRWQRMNAANKSGSRSRVFHQFRLDTWGWTARTNPVGSQDQSVTQEMTVIDCLSLFPKRVCLCPKMKLSINVDYTKGSPAA